MSDHKRYQGPGGARLARMRARQHITKDGEPKRRYTPAEVADVVERMNARPGRLPVTSYACPECGWMHVGTITRAWLRNREDPVVLLESGERVDACTRLENYGTQAQRIAVIVKRGESAERRAALRQPRPPRTTRLP